MKYNYDIYIKGRGHDNVASCAIVIIKDGVEVFSEGRRFVNAIPTRAGKIDLLPNRAQYQMELYALAWALTKCENDSIVKVYTNNIVSQTWIERMVVGDAYENLFYYCKNFAKGKTIMVEHVKKGSDEYTKKSNDIAMQYEYV